MERQNGPNVSVEISGYGAADGAQADLAGHGGEHRAVSVYQMDSYHY
jgi:MOSC domain-containing protein YiiM